MKPVGTWGGDKPFYKKKLLNMHKQVEHLKNLNVDIYCHIIYKESDLEDLKDILQILDYPHWKTHEKMEIWPVLLPPSEGLSEPFNIEWSRWAKVFKALHLLYPRLNGVVIDDFNWMSNKMDNLEIWEKDWVTEQFKAMFQILSSVDIKFYPVVYENKLLVEEDRFRMFVNFVENFPGVKGFQFDGLIVPWMNLCSSARLAFSLDRVKHQFPTKKLIGMVYASSTSWHLYEPPVQAYRKAINMTYRKSDAMVNYCIPSKGPIYKATKKFFKEIKI